MTDFVLPVQCVYLTNRAVLGVHRAMRVYLVRRLWLPLVLTKCLQAVRLI